MLDIRTERIHPHYNGETTKKKKYHRSSLRRNTEQFSVCCSFTSCFIIHKSATERIFIADYGKRRDTARRSDPREIYINRSHFRWPICIFLWIYIYSKAAVTMDGYPAYRMLNVRLSSKPKIHTKMNYRKFAHNWWWRCRLGRNLCASMHWRTMFGECKTPTLFQSIRSPIHTSS